MKRPLHVAISSWGEDYVNLMLRVALPSLAAPGNLPYLAEKNDLTMDIYTRAADAEKIRAHPAFKALHQKFPINFIPLIDALPKEMNSMTRMNTCQCRALVKANEIRAPIILPNSDTLLSDGLGRLIHQAFEEGKRAVIVQGTRLKEEPVLRFIHRRFGDNAAALALPPRELAALCLETVHPYCGHQFIDHPRFIFSMELYWSVGSKGFLARNFGQGIIAVWPQNLDVLPGITLDSTYLSQAVPSIDSYHVICDSDEGAVFSLTPEWQMAEAIPARENPFSPAHYAMQITRFLLFKHVDQMHLRYFQKKIRVHSGPMIEEEWSEIEKESDTVVAQILREVHFLLRKCANSDRFRDNLLRSDPNQEKAPLQK